MGVTIYLVRPHFAETREVVRQYDNAGRWVEVAQELARLAGDGERARRVGDVWLRLYMRNPRVLHIEDIDEMLGLLEGLELQLVGTAVDEKWRVKSEQLADLRARTTTLDLDESRGGAELHKESGLLVGVG